MEAIYPVYLSLEECTAECGSLVSYCTGRVPHIVCQLNFYIFLFVIFLAVCTGVFIPVSCLFCWVNGGCNRSKTSSNSAFSIFSKRRRNRPNTFGFDEEKSSLYPSSPPTLTTPAVPKSRQASSFSLPAHNVIVEEEGNATETKWQKSKRCRKITFDLSMTSRVNEFSEL